jgi:Ser/Thr protein kinase RdoA (MazF antagonist)
LDKFAVIKTFYANYSMTQFPVSSSILSANHLATYVQSRYEFNENTTCRLLKAGVNHSYLITHGTDKFVFRVYSLGWRTETAIAEEIKLLNRLKEQGIPVSYPVADAAQNYIQEMDAPEGKRYGVLFSFAPGDKVMSYSTDIHYKVGEAMAKMHLLTHDQSIDRVSYNASVLIESSVNNIRPFIDNHSEEFIFLEKVKRYLVSQLDILSTSTLRKGIVHLDIWYDNMHFDSDGHITIFDFDFCGNGWLCLDIGYYIMQLHKIEKDETEYQVKLKSFLDGYQSITPVSEEEMNAVPVMGLSVFIFFLGVQCIRYENWSNVFLNEIHLKLFINLLIKRWYNYHHLPEGN